MSRDIDIAWASSLIIESYSSVKKGGRIVVCVTLLAIRFAF